MIQLKIIGVHPNLQEIHMYNPKTFTVVSIKDGSWVRALELDRLTLIELAEKLHTDDTPININIDITNNSELSNLCSPFKRVYMDSIGKVINTRVLHSMHDYVEELLDKKIGNTASELRLLGKIEI